MRQTVCALVLVLVAWATAADAQSPYVGASFFGDVVRTSGPSTDSNGDGEALGGALRVGVPLTDRWGVELELALSGKIDVAPDAFIARTQSIAPFDDPRLFPIPEFSSERQLTTISTLAWWNHEISSRVSLAYLGGVSFTRTEAEVRYSFRELIFPPIPPLPVGGVFAAGRSFEQETVSYDADVVVGLEGRIGMTEHLRLVPGVRLQTAAGGWAIRPAVGLQWMF